MKDRVILDLVDDDDDDDDASTTTTTTTTATASCPAVCQVQFYKSNRDFPAVLPAVLVVVVVIVVVVVVVIWIYFNELLAVAFVFLCSSEEVFIRAEVVLRAVL